MFNRPYNPKTRHYIRILAGLYLLHLSWSLRAELRTPGLLMLACLLFAVVGAAFIVTAARVLLQKEEEPVTPASADVDMDEEEGDGDPDDPNDPDADGEDPDNPEREEGEEEDEDPGIDPDDPDEADGEEEDE